MGGTRSNGTTGAGVGAPPAPSRTNSPEGQRLSELMGRPAPDSSAVRLAERLSQFSASSLEADRGHAPAVVLNPTDVGEIGKVLGVTFSPHHDGYVQTYVAQIPSGRAGSDYILRLVNLRDETYIGVYRAKVS